MIDYETHKPDGTKDLLVLRLTGNLDAQTSDFLLDCVQGHVEDGISKFVLDCGDLDYVSSMGLGALVRANTRLKKSGGSIAISSVKGVVAEVLQISRLDRLFNIFPSEDKAIEALAAA